METSIFSGNLRGKCGVFLSLDLRASTSDSTDWWCCDPAISKMALIGNPLFWQEIIYSNFHLQLLTTIEDVDLYFLTGMWIIVRAFLPDSSHKVAVMSREFKPLYHFVFVPIQICFFCWVSLTWTKGQFGGNPWKPWYLDGKNHGFNF